MGNVRGLEFTGRRAGTCPFISGITQCQTCLILSWAGAATPVLLLPALRKSRMIGLMVTFGTKASSNLKIREMLEKTSSPCIENTQIELSAFKHNYFLGEIRNSDFFFLESVSFDELPVRQKKHLIKNFPGCSNWHEHLATSLLFPKNKAEF